MKISGRELFLALSVFLCVSCALGQVSEARPKNVILIIGDGMGFAQVKSYRYYADDPSTALIDPLAFDPYLVGAVATDSISYICAEGENELCVRDPYGITDSASSASAYATGQDTQVGRLGIATSGEIQPNISEMARRQGKVIGLVATSQITHATPAAFAAHVESRGEYHVIANQLFDNQYDNAPLCAVLLGGGRADLQRDDRDLVAEFAQAGYALASNRDELLHNKKPHILGLFAPIGLARAWDRDASTPSLADMTSAAIKALTQNPQGFFLLIEGSQIDWAAHANDITGVISETEDLDAAIKVALEFAAARDDTLVVITADHETGGLSLGRGDNDRWDPSPLRGLKRTPAAITEEFLAGEEPLSQIVARNVPFELTVQEQTDLNAYGREPPVDPAYGVDGVQAYLAINRLLDQRTLTGWSTMGHTGVDVPLYATGPGSEKFHGTLQNEELGQRLQAVFLP